MFVCRYNGSNRPWDSFHDEATLSVGSGSTKRFFEGSWWEFIHPYHIFGASIQHRGTTKEAKEKGETRTSLDVGLGML